MDTKSQTKKPMSVQERLQEASLKEMEKQTKLQTASRLQQGQSPDEILQALNGLAQTPVDRPGTITGIIPALVQMVKGQGFNPMSPKKGELGLDNAIKLQGLMTDISEAERRQASSQRKAPGEMAKSQNELLKLAQNQAQITGDYSLLNALTQQIRQSSGGVADQQENGIESDPAFDPALRQEFIKQDLDRTFANRKELDEYTRKFTPVVRDVTLFQDIAEKLPDYKGGIINQMIAKGDVVAKVIAADPVAVRFNAAIDSGLAGFARTGGDTGALSDNDQKRIKEVLGKTNIPFKEKVQIYNDMLDKFFVQLDTRKEQAKDPGYDKRFPLIKKAKNRYEKNKVWLMDQGRKQGGEEEGKLTMDNLFEGLE